jgi:hypothetical protein
VRSSGAGGGATPEAKPRKNTAKGSPRADTPAPTSGKRSPRASTPRASTPRASTPRASTPRASTPPPALRKSLKRTVEGGN